MNRRGGFKREGLEGLTVVDLKRILGSYKLSTVGKKAELLKRLEDYLAKHGSSPSAESLTLPIEYAPFEEDHPFSNSSIRPFRVALNGQDFNFMSIRHFLITIKAYCFGFVDIAGELLTIENPSVLRGYEEKIISPSLEGEWKEFLVGEKVFVGFYEKFRQNEDLMKALLGMKNVPIFFMSEDRFWGYSGGKGENILGKIIERIRSIGFI